MDNIIWKRMGRPQDDMYDSGVLAMLEHERCGWTKTPPTGKTFCDGNIAIIQSPDSYMGEGVNVATDEQIEGDFPVRLTDALKAWPAGYNATVNFLDGLQAFYSPLLMGEGCMSGHHYLSPSRKDHTVYVTVNSLNGLVQGILHELGHLRLETMGIFIETHDFKLLLNPPEELYNSSVRFDKKRPMSAVLHGLYAWLMFTESDYQRYQLKQIPFDYYSNVVGRNIPKIQNGWAEVNSFARWTPEGVEFFAGLTDWTNDLVARVNG